MNNTSQTSPSWRAKSARFVRYVTTRPAECWGFFAVGIVVAKIFL